MDSLPPPLRTITASDHAIVIVDRTLQTFCLYDVLTPNRREGEKRFSKGSLLGVSAACRESFCVFTFRTSFITQPAGPATYSQGKGRYSWIIFRKISPYNLLRRPVRFSYQAQYSYVKLGWFRLAYLLMLCSFTIITILNISSLFNLLNHDC